MNTIMGADDRKRSRLISVKVTERMELDLMRLAASRERALSDFIYRGIRQILYGHMVRLEDSANGFTSSEVIALSKADE